MDTFFWIIGILVINTLLGLAGVLALWIHDEKKLKVISYLLVAFSAGALIGGGLLHLIPEGAEKIPIFELALVMVIGFAVFLILETYLHWHSCQECEIHPFTRLVLIGDGIHNIIDGIVVATTFIAGIPIGIVASLGIMAHEVPQELGVFGVQVHGGVKKEKALLYSVLAQSTCLIGGVLGYFLAREVGQFVDYMLPFAAGGFIYIAAADLIPELHKEEGIKKIMGLAVFFVALLFMYMLKVYGGE